MPAGEQFLRKFQVWIVGISIISLPLFILISFNVAGIIENPIRNVVRGMVNNAPEVTGVSRQIAIARQKLATGASDQVVAEEEASAALTHMAEVILSNPACCCRIRIFTTGMIKNWLLGFGDGDKIGWSMLFLGGEKVSNTFSKRVIYSINL